ncbi:helix-turn-helix transcriptional regulator [Jatrophihabitans telluris]|uniref:Helix-turn-helix transcriptional regulator n=1 Tax=Jatrophihabitans telluris TaxID=2038343 RepID=A0ABY4QWE8_9ACTN|nr:helix-turn-helix domain-containing protein [Jatrophihabitans telluris]UQX87457.1 helix-turn-helix transcriptional regulator [Jatrophihabitans telluris]
MAARLREESFDVTRYTDYCPIGTGIDVFGDRWTPLVIREMSVGATGFNEIHRGIPRISRTLLSQRLRTLESHRLVRRETGGQGRSGSYVLTDAGQALVPIVWSIGHWAARWLYTDPTEQVCDGQSLLWRMHQRADAANLPAMRTVVQVILTGAGGAEGWLDIDRDGMTVCKDDQGKDVDLVVQAETGQLYKWLAGITPFRELVASGHVRLIGPSRMARAFPTWFTPAPFGDDLRRSSRRVPTR